MFQGHQLIKLINDNWVLDFTDYIGYNVKTDAEGNIRSYKEAFQAEIIENDIIFEKKCRVPLKVLREAANQIREYHRDMVEDNE